MINHYSCIASSHLISFTLACSNRGTYTVPEIPKEFCGMYRPRTVSDVMLFIVDLMTVALENPSLVDGKVPNQLIKNTPSSRRRTATSGADRVSQISLPSSNNSKN